MAYVDRGYTGERAAEKAKAHGMRLEVVKHEEAKRGFVLLPRRWVVERDFAWASRFRQLAKDYERLPATLAGLHFVAFVRLFLRQAAGIPGAGSQHPPGRAELANGGAASPRPPALALRIGGGASRLPGSAEKVGSRENLLRLAWASA